jgi:hypothetical protein
VTPPAIPPGTLPCARVFFQYPTTEITNSIIYDERVLCDQSPTQSFSVAVRADLNNVDQTGLAPTTFTKVNFSTADFNIGNAFNTSNSRFAPAAPGYYAISAQVSVNIPNGTLMSNWIYKNGSQYSYNKNADVGSGYFTAAISDSLYLNGTDYVEIYVWQGGSTTLTISGQRIITFLSAYRVA